MEKKVCINDRMLEVEQSIRRLNSDLQCQRFVISRTRQPVGKFVSLYDIILFPLRNRLYPRVVTAGLVHELLGSFTLMSLIHFGLQTCSPYDAFGELRRS